jgi:hypothetical protein
LFVVQILGCYCCLNEEDDDDERYIYVGEFMKLVFVTDFQKIFIEM